MKNIIFILIFLLILQGLTQTSSNPSTSQIQQHISYLHKRLNGPSYWDHDQHFKFMLTWQHMKGIYQSRVHFNILDKKNRPWTAQIRQNLFKIDDINMFVSSFVLYGLLQAESFGTIKIDHHKFSQTLESITQFRDKNTPPGMPQYLFWPQINQNGTWAARSVNLLNIINMSPSFPPSWNNWLTKHGLGILTMVKKFADFFCIPPDNDDSGVNLALLGLMKETNSSHFTFFDSFNYKKLEFYNQVLKYAYRPFESNFNQNKRCNQIDPRTYYVLHDFITAKRNQALARNETPSLILPTTWLLNQDEQKPGKIFMPFETNNVDATVSANFLFGLTFQLMTDTIKPSDLHPDLLLMVHNTVDLIEYVIETVSKDRLDLILVYYPSKYDFYWFVARILNLLKRNLNTKLQNPEYSDFKTVFERLSKLMKTQGTQNIIANKKDYAKAEGAVMWEEFLGNYGKKDRHEDALFSTALALNALLDTWTTKSGPKLAFDVETPQQVQSTIQKGVLYLQTFITKEIDSKTGYRMKLENAFFSGSMKIFKTSFPYFYPANIHYDKEGKNFDPNNMQLKDLQFGSKYYVKGFIDASEYKQMLSKKWFGSQVPTTFTGFNDGVGLSFPYWSSKAISEIMMITALSKFMRATQNIRLQ